jgi:hypothetical protein
MQSSSIPAKFPIPWANAAQSQFIRNIPVASQIGVQDGAASLTDGFVPDNFTQIAAGGVPPFGQDFNGILKQVTQWNQWQQLGGPITFDATFASETGGYLKGTILQSAIVPGRLWLSTIDNNTNNPDANFPATGWVALPGTNPPGTPVASFQAATLPGHVLAIGETIGNTGSGGSTPPQLLASPQAFFLFCAIWLQFSQAECPVQFNGVTVTRGANPLADWNAGNVIQLPWMAGAGVIGQDNMGTRSSSFLSSVPVQLGNANLPGSIVGENLHTLTGTEIPPVGFSGTTGVDSPDHEHGYSAPLNQGLQNGTGGTIILSGQQGSFTSGATERHQHSFSGAINGGGGAHNNVQRNFTAAWNLAL